MYAASEGLTTLVVERRRREGRRARARESRTAPVFRTGSAARRSRRGVCPGASLRR
ncbi:MAG: hypothetical protein M3292_09225 [Actinomycetota bacterium]|nr:hypothetical protein [Actinomycetota bacterium]